MTPEIARKKAELDRLRPLSARSTLELDRWYDVEITYTSNALEGNTLTRTETAVVLEKGITVSGKPLRDHLEATGHLAAMEYVRELAKAAEPIREIDIRNIHQLIMQRVDPDEAGSYSTHQRLLTGSTFVPPSPAELLPLMAEFTAWLASTALTPLTAFTAHERFVTIHPFSDGNGRTGRLLMNLLLLKAGFPPISIPPELRVAYLDALVAIQTTGQREPYESLLNQQLEATLDHYLRVLS